jgi:hypothetical protein
MVHRVAGDTAINGADAAMAGATSFPKDYVFMLGVANLADGGVAIFVNAPNFTRRQADLSVAFVAGHERCSAASGTDHLAAASRR